MKTTLIQAFTIAVVLSTSTITSHCVVALQTIPEATHVTESICPMGSRCTRCNDTTVPTGTCVSSPIRGHSRVINCGTVYHSCADLAHYENKDCTGFIGTMAPVCGSCARFGNASTHTKITCDEGTQSVSLSHNCNRDCSLCDPAEVVPFHSCAASPHGNHTSSTFHRGLFPCSTVRVRDYDSKNCSGDPDHEMIVAEYLCEMNERYVCSKPHERSL